MNASPSIILVAASEDDGGLARVASALASGLSDSGLRVAVALQRESNVSRELVKRGLPVHVVPELIEALVRTPEGQSSLCATVRNIATIGRGVQRLRDIAERHRADLFYSHGSWPNHLVAEATRGWRGKAPGAVWHVHTACSRSNLMAAQVMARRGDLRTIIGVSNSVIEPYRAIGGRTDVIHNGVDLEACARAAAAPSLRRELGIPQDAFVFGYAGRLVPEKGVTTLAAAACKVLGAVPTAHFVLLGGNPKSVRRDVLGGLRRQFRAAGFGARAHLPGYRPEALSLIAGFDVAVVPSIYPDPCPLAALEAQALGAPVLASRVGGLPEVVEHGASGLLLPPGDPDALAAALIELAGQPDRRRSMGESARRTAGRRFDSRMMVARAAEALHAAALAKRAA